MKTELIDISLVKNNPSNPRLIKDEKYFQLIQSIKDFPQMLEIRPIVVNDDMIVLGGNMRLRACKEAGLKKVHVIKASVLTPEQQKEFIIKDNVGFGEWDWAVIANEWDEKQLQEWGMDLPVDFGGKAEAEEDDFDVPVGGSDTDIVLGDIFDIGQHRLLCGSSTQTDTWDRLMGQEMADLVITDPPYNVNYIGKTKDALKIDNDKQSDGDFYQFLYDFYTALGTYTKAGGVWYIWHADSEGANFRKAMADAGIMVKQCLIWVKNRLVMGRQDYHWQHEPCLYGWKEGAAHGWYSDRKQTTVLNFERPNRNAEHPTMKPIPLIAYQMSNSSKGGDIVADGFGGSGTTMVVAEQMKRSCRMIELDPRYCQVIIDRMLKLDPNLNIKLNGKSYKPTASKSAVKQPNLTNA